MSIFKKINQKVSKWFDSEQPITKESISTPEHSGVNRYAPPERLAELEVEFNESNVIDWEDSPSYDYEPHFQENPLEWFIEKPDKVEQEKTLHQKMYEIATSRYNPFSLGGSENCDSDVSCNVGGSENAQKL